MKSNILSSLVILISLFFYAFSVQAQEKPDNFVQRAKECIIYFIDLNFIQEVQT